MDRLNASIVQKTDRPVVMMQFGEGNFLRAFADYMVDILNEKTDFNGSVVIVKPIERGDISAFKAQDCLYTVMLRGLVNQKKSVQTRLVTSVKEVIDPFNEYEKYQALAQCDTLRLVVSNTTEAGIVFDEEDDITLCPPKSFPLKLTKFLYERAKHFDFDVSKGLVMLPVELIDDNGLKLKECVLKHIEKFALGDKFLQWVNQGCVFTSTLVDRIVTGRVQDENERNDIFNTLGYQDDLLVTAEPFGLWVIEGPESLKAELPFEKAGLPVVFTDNQKPYKERKVRILNGAHTSFVPMAFLMGHDTVLQSMQDDRVNAFIKHTLFDEIIPTLSLDKKDLEMFANAVLERFSNPFIQHQLLSITLNSVSKFTARCLKSLLMYQDKMQQLPQHLTFSLAALIAFYNVQEKGEGCLMGERNGMPYKVVDDPKVLDFFYQNKADDAKTLCQKVLQNTSFFGSDLTEVQGLLKDVTLYLTEIQNSSMIDAVQKYFG